MSSKYADISVVKYYWANNCIFHKDSGGTTAQAAFRLPLFIWCRKFIAVIPVIWAGRGEFYKVGGRLQSRPENISLRILAVSIRNSSSAVSMFFILRYLPSSFRFSRNAL